MAYPPVIPPADVTNTTPQVDRHPADHNAITDALRDILNELGIDPAGAAATVTDRFVIIEQQVTPYGVFLPYGGAAAPAGWFLCDGQVLNRAANPKLFAAIGVTWGAGDGSTTFKTPDLRGRFIAGKGAVSWCDVLAELGGSKDAVVVAHGHTQAQHVHDMSHEHAAGGGNQSNGFFTRNYLNNGAWGAEVNGTVAGGAYLQPPTSRIVANTGLGGGDNVNSSGESGTDKNLPPYAVMNYIGRLG